MAWKWLLGTLTLTIGLTLCRGLAEEISPEDHGGPGAGSRGTADLSKVAPVG